MIVVCAHCDRRYDDARSWTTCPQEFWSNAGVDVVPGPRCQIPGCDCLGVTTEPPDEATRAFEQEALAI